MSMRHCEGSRSPRISRCFESLALAVAQAGSVTIDAALMAAANISPFGQVHVLDIDNGARLSLRHRRRTGSGELRMNRAAASCVYPGDRVIVITYAEVDENELDGFTPIVVHVGDVVIFLLPRSPRRKTAQANSFPQRSRCRAVCSHFRIPRTHGRLFGGLVARG